MVKPRRRTILPVASRSVKRKRAPRARATSCPTISPPMAGATTRRTGRAPARGAYLHHAIADESVSRWLLAWSASVPQHIVCAAGLGTGRRICLWTDSIVKASISRTLAAEQKVSDDEIAYKVSSHAILVFLAILDQLRAVRLHAMLVHADPVTTFSPAEIMEKLAGAGKEDFRWPLLFVDKVLPGLATSLTAHDAAEGLRELIAAKLVEAVVETPQSHRYDLTLGGKVICDAVVHDIGKVALSVCDQRADGQYGHDLVFLEQQFRRVVRMDVFLERDE